MSKELFRVSLGGTQQAGRGKRQTHHPRGNYPRPYFEKGHIRKHLLLRKGAQDTPVQVKVWHDGDDGHGGDADGCDDPSDHSSDSIRTLSSLRPS